MGRIFKAILVLLVAAGLGILGYAYFGDMSAEPVELRTPVALPDLVPPPSAPPAAAPAAAMTPAAPAAAETAQPAPEAATAGAGLDD